MDPELFSMGEKVMESWNVEHGIIRESHIDVVEQRGVDLGHKVFGILNNTIERKAG